MNGGGKGGAQGGVGEWGWEGGGKGGVSEWGWKGGGVVSASFKNPPFLQMVI